MESINSALKIKLAWQEAYRLRSCPGDDMLFAEHQTIETKRHLKICPACSDIRDAAPQVRTAWRELGDRLSDGTSPHKATEVPPVEGQVWALSDDLSHWGSDGNFYRPPQVLLLGIEGNALKVAQTYHDTALAADGDVLLSGNRFGFAQAWNIYTIHREMLDHCIGVVKREELKDVLSEAGKPRAEIDENSVLYWFRTSEVMVGAEIAMPAVAQLMEEMETAQEVVKELLPGLRQLANDVFEFTVDFIKDLGSVYRPALVTRGGQSKSVAPKLTDEQKMLVHGHCAIIPVDLKLEADTLTMKLKWLRDKPDKLPVVKVVLNGVDVSDAGFTGATADKIVITHPLLSGVTTSQITSLKLGFIEDVLKLHISVVGTDGE